MLSLSTLADLYDRLGSREVPALENPHSYRGYYEQIAFEKAPSRVPATEVAEFLRRQIGETFEGYKGGHYVMDESTPVWIANYGRTGRYVVDVGLLNGDLITEADH